MDRDTITRTGARAPGVERLSRSHGGVALSHEPRHRARIIQGVRRHEGRVQTKRREDQAPQGQAPFDKPALEPYWGKPAVRKCVQRRLARSARDSPAKAKARSLVAWMAERRETNDLKPIDKVIVRMTASHRAAAKANAQVAPKGGSTGGRARFRRVKAAWRVVGWLARYSTPAG